MKSTETERDDGFGRSLTAVAVAAAVLTALAPFAIGRSSMLGVAIGGSLAVANLWAIAFIVRGFLRGAGIPFAVFGAIKFAALIFLVWIVLRNGWAGVMPLVLGYAALPIGIVVGQLRSSPTRQKV